MAAFASDFVVLSLEPGLKWQSYFQKATRTRVPVATSGSPGHPSHCGGPPECSLRADQWQGLSEHFLSLTREGALSSGYSLSVPLGYTLGGEVFLLGECLGGQPADQRGQECWSCSVAPEVSGS